MVIEHAEQLVIDPHQPLCSRGKLRRIAAVLIVHVRFKFPANLRVLFIERRIEDAAADDGGEGHPVRKREFMHGDLHRHGKEFFTVPAKLHAAAIDAGGLSFRCGEFQPDRLKTFFFHIKLLQITEQRIGQRIRSVFAEIGRRRRFDIADRRHGDRFRRETLSGLVPEFRNGNGNLIQVAGRV